MNATRKGFYLEHISVTGTDLPIAEVNFRDGLNVVAGASDTGKSFLCDLIDFVFGASKPPRRIDAARGYERVIARLRDRSTGVSHEIERALSGGDALIRSLEANGTCLEERVAAARHSADDSSTLSAFLLKLSGFDSVKVRKNKKGETRTLSFRDVAFLCLVDETRIIAELPPHLTGSPVEATVEREVFRFLATGQTAPVQFVAPKKTVTKDENVRTELFTQLREQLRKEIEALGFDLGGVREEVERVNEARAGLLQSYEAARVELVTLESLRADHGRELRDVESRIIVLEGLLARFQLLDGHYDSDIKRLVSIEETGMLLESLPATSCPVCGSAPSSHHPDEAAEHFGLSHVREAARKEIQKIKTLRSDLQKVLMGLNAEMGERVGLRTQLRGQVEAIQVRIEVDLQPQTRISLEKVREQDARRDSLLRARTLVERLEDLDKRVVEIGEVPNRSMESKPADLTRGTTSEMEPFAVCVQEILSAWCYPELGRVVFSEDNQDIVIGGQERVSHGKGVRALTCAAFITGILRHCWRVEIPHPGLVVLDSPLVAYKDPDTPGSESARLRRAGVKDAFFRTLAEGLCPGQLIVLENEDPPPDVSLRIVHHHFSKAATGRYGLFPRR
jgi:hypothetical protein